MSLQELKPTVYEKKLCATDQFYSLRQRLFQEKLYPKGWNERQNVNVKVTMTPNKKPSGSITLCGDVCNFTLRRNTLPFITLD